MSFCLSTNLGKYFYFDDNPSLTLDAIHSASSGCECMSLLTVLSFTDLTVLDIGQSVSDYPLKPLRPAYQACTHLHRK